MTFTTCLRYSVAISSDGFPSPRSAAMMAPVGSRRSGRTSRRASAGERLYLPECAERVKALRPSAVQGQNSTGSGGAGLRRHGNRVSNIDSRRTMYALFSSSCIEVCADEDNGDRFA